MDALFSILTRLVALCAFSALCDMLISGGKLLSSLRLIGGLLVVETVAEMIVQLIGLMRIA